MRYSYRSANICMATLISNICQEEQGEASFGHPPPPNKKLLCCPQTTVSPALAICGWCKLTPDRDPTPVGSHGSYWSSSKRVKFFMFRLSYKLTSDDIWPSLVTFDLINMWRFFNYINKPSLVPIGLQLFTWGEFTFWAYLDLWWPFTLVYGLWPHEHTKAPIWYQ